MLAPPPVARLLRHAVESHCAGLRRQARREAAIKQLQALLAGEVQIDDPVPPPLTDDDEEDGDEDDVEDGDEDGGSGGGRKGRQAGGGDESVCLRAGSAVSR